MTTRVLVPSGVLGLDFDEAALARGVKAGPDIIAIDGGSTDSGPFYLGTGVSKYSRAATASQWRTLMRARAEAGVPLVIGSCGTCGTDATVDWMVETTSEMARELGQRVRVATLYASQAPAEVGVAWQRGRVQPLVPAPGIDAAGIEACSNIVALAGVEQINAALATGADIVLAGRATDTASIAALPIARGEHAGAAWHAAKTAECGALCSTNPTSGVVMVSVDGTGFEVEAFADGARCTPHTVSAHMLYENADPFILYEPGGHLDVTEARYAALDERRVRVTGSRWVPSEAYTVKLEAARLAGYQAMALVLLRDAHYVRNAQAWVDRLEAFVAPRIEQSMGVGAGDYSLHFRLVGQNATLGDYEPASGAPAEVGVLMLVTGATQALALDIARLVNPWLLHLPLTDDEELPTFAFPFSPAESARGPMYEFAMNHVMVLDEPMDAFRLSVQELGAVP